MSDQDLIAQEGKTLQTMVGIYCRAKHQTRGALCPECQDLVDYAMERVGKCIFWPDKPVCSVCPVHCCQPEYREKIREVMRFAGPRMIFTDPVAAVVHLRKLKAKPSAKVLRMQEALSRRVSSDS